MGAKFPFNDFASNAFDTEEPVKWGRKYSSEILFLKNISQRMYVTDVQQFGLQVLYDIDGKDYSIFVVEIRLYMFCTYLPAFAVSRLRVRETKRVLIFVFMITPPGLFSNTNL